MLWVSYAKRPVTLSPHRLPIQTIRPSIPGWPHCLRVLETVSLLIPEANKVAIHSPLYVLSSYSLTNLSHWAFLSLPPSRVQLHHATLLDPQISFSR
jgi:hypothetical protein